MAQAPTIVFAGTPQFAVPALEALLAHEWPVPLVMTQPDRASGRGRHVAVSPVKALAVARRLDVLQPASLPRQPPPDWPPSPDLLIVAAYGLLLPQWLLDWPRVAAVNIHASLLPRWRGAAPIQHAILAGDTETGISIMRMVAALDAGPVYSQAVVPIGNDETAADLHDRLAALGAEQIVAAVPRIVDGSLSATPQDPAGVSYAPKIAKADGRLDWSDSAASLARKVRAFNPWPVAEGGLDDGRSLRIWQACALDEPAGAAPGTIVAADADGIVVATGDARLRIDSVQAPGARRMTVRDYLNAHALLGHRFVA